ncbi:MAG: cyclic peptide export ABC transporter [Spirulinaceae cyanobacterium]
MNLIYFLFKSSWQLVGIAVLMGFISGGSSAGLIALISKTVGDGVEGAPAIIAWGFAGLAMVALLTSIITRVVLIRLSQESIFQLQMRLSKQILATELTHLEKLGSPRLLATLTEDIQTIANAVYVLPFLFINLSVVAGCLIYITWLSWQVLFLVMALSFIALASCRLLLTKGRHLLTLARNQQDLLFKHFRTITEGTKELKLHYQRRQDFLKEDLQATAHQFKQYNITGLTLFATTDSWGKLILFFAIGLVLFILPNFLTISSQTLSGYVLTFTYLSGPMENIINKLPSLTKANIALQKITMLDLSLTNRAEIAPQPPKFKLKWQNLQLKEVVHTYFNQQEDMNFTLGPLDLELQPGEIVFIVGGNGSGKSTLAKLITGLYFPQAGSIYLDQQLIQLDNREWYRQHFAVVFSDFYLFERLLGFSQPNLDRQAQNYLKKLQLESKVKVKKGQLSTTTLSQGQRKRLALLTAYLEDRPIYLFDEWAADQDPTFKQVFYTQFLPQLKEQGKTILVISHDDSYFEVADRIIKLDYGKVIQKNL